MDRTASGKAALQIFEAQQSRRPLEALSADCVPASIKDGHAVQDALTALIGEPVEGYKVSGTVPAQVMRGAILRSRMHSSPAVIPAKDVPLLGIESEIAFRLDRDLPKRAQDYSYDELARAVTALPAIEVVSSRFADYHGTPVLHRLGDCMSNGALVCGQPRTDWRSFDFTKIAVNLSSNGDTIMQSIGGHPTGDPLLPMIGLANEMRLESGLKAGQIVTTGTFTGLLFGKPGDHIVAGFEGFGQVELDFLA